MCRCRDDYVFVCLFLLVLGFEDGQLNVVWTVESIDISERKLTFHTQQGPSLELAELRLSCRYRMPRVGFEPTPQWRHHPLSPANPSFLWYLERSIGLLRVLFEVYSIRMHVRYHHCAYVLRLSVRHIRAGHTIGIFGENGRSERNLPPNVPSTKIDRY